MTSNEIRQAFLDFFASKQHHIVSSAPMVLRNDPTLMFTNAGMNQFKDYFLGIEKAEKKRIADTQKCLRVSGKHNDLEEVGIDTYHHTMFEMLGNWSFGNYFKKEAIEWAWELLTEVFKLEKDRMYVTYFGGDPGEALDPDFEAQEMWRRFVPENHILPGNKKDNFWEMGDSGPCGPCSEIHVDLRSDDERKLSDGATHVNADHPQVIEIWNLVFIQYNRLASGKLEQLPEKHVDTGMGFERLVRAIEGKSSNYDTDVFMPLLKALSGITGIEYGQNEKTDIAFRVIVDHLRAVSFSIADGQLPSNVKAGYVIRRILRRAIRYGYSYLGLRDPFIHKMVASLVAQMGHYFTELQKQQGLIENVIRQEETTFLNTLGKGIDLFENYLQKNPDIKIIDGKFAFELFDTYGFPLDLTQLLAKEHEVDIDLEAFGKNLEEQKNRSRADAAISSGDWIEWLPDTSTEFVGYDSMKCDCRIVKYREVKQKGNTLYHIILDKTPFYAESGGQTGDSGILKSEQYCIVIANTIKEYNQVIHLTETEPIAGVNNFIAEVNIKQRLLTMSNHSATHLMHHALRSVLGTHVEQKGSLLNAEYLRFDFSHFQKLSEVEIATVEYHVNTQIRAAITLAEYRNLSYNDAIEKGAMALFGEKYGNEVRMIEFGDSRELCGGTHVSNTASIGYFKIVSESAIAAGIRRIEAITSESADHYIAELDHQAKELKNLLKGKNPVETIKQLNDQVTQLQGEIQQLKKEKLTGLIPELIAGAEMINGICFIGKIMDVDSGDIRNLAFALRNREETIVALLASNIGEKAGITVFVSDTLVRDKKVSASEWIKILGKEIGGSGGGQAFLASAGGTNKNGYDKAIAECRKLLQVL